VIESLDLDGALIIDYKDGQEVIIRNKVVKNSGWALVKDENSEDEIIKMRGYHIERYEEERMEPSFCTIS